MDFPELNDLRSVAELEEHQKEVRGRIVELDTEHAGRPFPEDARSEYAELRDRDTEVGNRVTELKARAQHIADLARDDSRVERTWQATAPSRTTGDNVFDLSSVPRDLGNPAVEGREMRDRALKVVERATFVHPDVRQEDARDHVERLLGSDSIDGRMARYMVATANPVYSRAFGKVLAGEPLNREEQSAVNQVQLASRAMSLTGSAGGYAVPFELDPTIIPTSNSSVNPWRAVARVVNVTVDEWRGISAGAITAAYAAEATESSDNSPTLAQPTISTEKAQAFIPFSIELGMDWNGLQAEMARLLQDSKDDLEATKFAVGSGTNEPQGVITGATTVVTATGTGAFAIADLDTLEAALPPRFQPRASIVMSRFVAQKIRHFDTSGAAGVWNQSLQLVSGLPVNRVGGSYETRVLGYPAYEASAMAATLTTGSAIAILGDFNYYVIVDRIGLNVEVIPHLVGTNHRPTGQRGLYAYWRNSAGVISPSAFRVLHTG